LLSEHLVAHHYRLLRAQVKTVWEEDAGKVEERERRLWEALHSILKNSYLAPLQPLGGSQCVMNKDRWLVHSMSSASFIIHLISQRDGEE